jgi:hypothetical protein
MPTGSQLWDLAFQKSNQPIDAAIPGANKLVRKAWRETSQVLRKLTAAD